MFYLSDDDRGDAKARRRIDRFLSKRCRWTEFRPQTLDRRDDDEGSETDEMCQVKDPEENQRNFADRSDEHVPRIGSPIENHRCQSAEKNRQTIKAFDRSLRIDQQQKKIF